MLTTFDHTKDVDKWNILFKSILQQVKFKDLIPDLKIEQFKQAFNQIPESQKLEIFEESKEIILQKVANTPTLVEYFSKLSSSEVTEESMALTDESVTANEKHDGGNDEVALVKKNLEESDEKKEVRLEANIEEAQGHATTNNDGEQPAMSVNNNLNAPPPSEETLGTLLSSSFKAKLLQMPNHEKLAQACKEKINVQNVANWALLASDNFEVFEAILPVLPTAMKKVFAGEFLKTMSRDSIKRILRAVDQGNSQDLKNFENMIERFPEETRLEAIRRISPDLKPNILFYFAVPKKFQSSLFNILNLLPARDRLAVLTQKNNDEETVESVLVKYEMLGVVAGKIRDKIQEDVSSLFGTSVQDISNLSLNEDEKRIIAETFFETEELVKWLRKIPEGNLEKVLEITSPDIFKSPFIKRYKWREILTTFDHTKDVDKWNILFKSILQHKNFKDLIPDLKIEQFKQAFNQIPESQKLEIFEESKEIILQKVANIPTLVEYFSTLSPSAATAEELPANQSNQTQETAHAQEIPKKILTSTTAKQVIAAVKAEDTNILNQANDPDIIINEISKIIAAKKDWEFSGLIGGSTYSDDKNKPIPKGVREILDIIKNPDFKSSEKITKIKAIADDTKEWRGLSVLQMGLFTGSQDTKKFYEKISKLINPEVPSAGPDKKTP